MTTMAIDNKDKKVLKSSIEREQNELACSAECEKIKGSKDLNVPHLRFPEFSGEWEKCKLSEVCSFFSGGTPPSSKKEYYDGSIPFIRSGEIHMDKTELFITEEGLNNSAAKMVEIGDLLLALYGATSGDIAISQIRGAINQAILCLRTTQNKKFIESVWKKHVGRLLQTYLQGGQGNLSADIVKNLSFYFANDNEQTKLAKFISLLDERIATQNKLIEDLKKLKSAISENLFKAVKSDVVILSEICEIIKGKQVNGEFLSVKGKYYVMNGGTEPSGYYSDYNVKANTISISEGGNSCGYVQFNTSPFWSGGHCYTIQKIADNVDNLYLYHYLKSKENAIMKLRIGSGLPNIQKKELAIFKIKIPTAKQQKVISTFLSSLERKAEIEERIRNSILEEKRCLLHQMFI